MVKFIGRDDRYLFKVTCKECASILEYWETEVTKTYSRDISGCSEAYHYINCPMCLKKVDVTYRKRK